MLLVKEKELWERNEYPQPYASKKGGEAMERFETGGEHVRHTSEEERVRAFSLPRIRERVLQGKRILIVGGDRRSKKIQRVSTEFGIYLEWRNCAGRTCSRILDGIIEQIHRGSVVGVLFLNGMSGHPSYERVSKACRATGTPLRYVGRGGLSRIRIALFDIERDLVSVQTV